MTPRLGYYVQIQLHRFEYSQYEGVEYDDFVRVAEANGFTVDIPRTDFLIKPIVTYVDITTPGQWALYEMLGRDISDERAMYLLKRYDCPECRYAA
jgi:hypothetical protein